MRRWLVLSLGLGIAAAGAYALLTARLPEPAPHAAAPRPEALDEIDATSRARLEDILREDHEAGGER